MFLFCRRLVAALLLSIVAYAPAAYAHVGGYTDTSIQVATPGVRIIYTVPADSLIDLEQGPSQDRSQRPARSIRHYSAQVAAGWRVLSDHAECTLMAAQPVELAALKSYQYRLSYRCPGSMAGLGRLSISYSLFAPEQFPSHQNYTRLVMAEREQRFRFTAERRRLELPVAQLLKDWDRKLTSRFLDRDPNRSLKDPPPAESKTDTAPGWQRGEADIGFIGLGVEHILIGADHVLVVLGLLLVPASWRARLIWVTCFTLAHSLSLGLAMIGWLRLSPALTEPLIALTVAWIGVENLLLTRWRHAPLAEHQAPPLRLPRHRAAWFFGVGLIHGVGFSYVLEELAFGEALARTLLYFNLGVELGQLLILIAAMPFIWLLFRQPQGLRLASVASALIALAGLVWFIERLSS